MTLWDEFKRLLGADAATGNRTMYDSLDLNGIPADAEMICYYPHDSRTSGSLSRFTNPRRVILTIDNTGGHPDCDILDLEPGAAWPPSVVPGWLVAHKNMKGNVGTVYSNTSTFPSIPKTQPFFWWAAAWGTGPTVIPGSVAHQYANPGPNDISVVYDANWHPFGGVTPPPPPPNPEPVLRQGATGSPVVHLQTRLNVWHANPALVLDGSFGPKTDSAVRLFQHAHALAADGVVGPATWAALDKNPAPPPPPPPPPPVTRAGVLVYVAGTTLQSKTVTSTDNGMTWK